MLKNIFYLFLLVFSIGYSQQTSTIKHIKSNGGKIEVIQNGNDSTKNSTIDSVEGDTFSIKVHQNNNLSKLPKKEVGGFKEWVSYTNNLVALFISIATFLGLIWKGIPAIKKLMSKK